jgi:hypothetical protein
MKGCFDYVSGLPLSDRSASRMRGDNNSNSASEEQAESLSRVLSGADVTTILDIL